jgi:hypothetical protein
MLYVKIKKANNISSSKCLGFSTIKVVRMFFV